jgi:integrase
MDAAGKFVYVRKVRMWAEQVFDWAVENGHAKINPAAQIRPEKAFGKTKVRHFAALALEDVPTFLRRLDEEADLNSVIACRMLAYTWVRTTELRQMRWDEIHEDRWVIPAERMKRGREHVVPLSRQALALLDEMRSRAFPGSDYACRVSCDHIPRRSWPLFRAQDILSSFPHMFGLSGRGCGRSVATPLPRPDSGPSLSPQQIQEASL